MLEGINVISTNVIKGVDFWLFLLITAIAGILFFLGISLFEVSKKIEEQINTKRFKIYWKIVNYILMLALLFFSVIVEAKAINDCFLNPIYYTEYTVTISDKVGYNEFTERYEIIEHKEDNTYVIREKTNVD